MRTGIINNKTIGFVAFYEYKRKSFSGALLSDQPGRMFCGQAKTLDKLLENLGNKIKRAEQELVELRDTLDNEKAMNFMGIRYKDAKRQIERHKQSLQVYSNTKRYRLQEI